VEIKSVESLAPVHKKQLLTYLRLADKRLGLLINFHVPLIKDGITRIVNGLEDEDHGRVGERATPRCDPLSPRRTGQADFPASGSPESFSSQACTGSCTAASSYKRTSPNRWICS